ncbi:MAG: GAF and ANTAR domain-containing protein [Actinomycetota bacterium]|nr:GAF and ANTAR domain-containing protein [Actinomycetota bacterium]
MSVLSRFVTAFSALDEPTLSGPESLPVRLAIACARVLPVDATGISVMDVLRVPLGASSADAEAVERAQVTIGDGPCIFAFSTGEPVLATQDQMTQSWPIFSERVLTQTRIRSVGSVPLRTLNKRLGALDLYWRSPRGATTIAIPAALEVANHIAAVLLAEPDVTTLHGVTGPGWVDAAAAQRRMQVWQAVGMLNVACALSSADAIAVLRAYAYSHDSTLDSLAEDLLSGAVPLHDVAPLTSAT